GRESDRPSRLDPGDRRVRRARAQRPGREGVRRGLSGGNREGARGGAEARRQRVRSRPAGGRRERAQRRPGRGGEVGKGTIRRPAGAARPHGGSNGLKVMLTKDVENVGRAGDIKEVADGYGRNYLLPRKLAIIARKGVEEEARRLR